MAYEIMFYCSTGGVSAEQALAELFLQCESVGAALWVGERRSGEGWAEADIDLMEGEARSGELRLEIQASSEMVSQMVDDVVDTDPSGLVRKADAIATLTLSGRLYSWGAVRAVWRALDSLWPTVPFDDVSGFDVTLASLG